MFDYNLYGMALDAIEELMVEFDTKGRIVGANEKAVEEFAYPDSMTNTYIWEMFPNFFAKDGDGYKATEELDHSGCDLTAYRANRTCLHVKCRMFDNGKEGSNVLFVMVDMTKSDMYEKEIIRISNENTDAMKVKNEFVANVTHELRTPVNGILGNTKSLIENETDPKKLKVLSLVERGCNDMHSIINNILDFSKLDAGKFEIDPKEFVFREMMDYVKSSHNYKITEKGLNFFVTIAPDIPDRVIGDDLRITQVLNNLLSNATKFTEVGKIVCECVKTSQIGKKIELFFLIMDTGIGMNKEGMAKLFNGFTQVDASISRKYGGTGLGLYISKSLVELMGGNISVESEPGVGTTFSFSIWVDLPDDEYTGEDDFTVADRAEVMDNLKKAVSSPEEKAAAEYGTPENLKELENRLSKLILSVEMDNWEKAETFMTGIKAMTETAPREVKSLVLRLKMSIQKEDYEKVVDAYEKINEIINAGE